MLRLLAALLALALLAGCADRGGEEDTGFALRVCLGESAPVLDPAMAADRTGETVLSHLFEGLMRRRDDGTGALATVPGMAREYSEVSNFDGTVTYTFTLRSTARWSDGKRVKADDFVYAWQRLADPLLASPNHALLSVVAGYDTVRETGDRTALRVRAKGDYTFIVTLSAPCTYFIDSICASPATAPLRRALVSENEHWNDPAELVTNGPYRLGGWSEGSSARLVRNREYYESRLLGPKEVSFVFADARSAYELYENGELDFLFSPPEEEAAESLAAQEDYEPAPRAAVSCVLYNNLTDLFSDKNARRAFDLVLDREALAAALASAPASGLVPHGISDAPGAKADYRTTGGDLLARDTDYEERCRAAGAMLALSGHPLGIGLDDLELAYPEGQMDLALALREAWWEALGVTVILRMFPSDEYEEVLRSGQYMLALATYTTKTDDAMSFLARFCGDSPDNVVGCCNDTYDLLLGVAETTADPRGRVAFLHDAEVLLIEDCALSPLLFATEDYLLRDGFSGIAQDCFGRCCFAAVSYAPPAVTEPAA